MATFPSLTKIWHSKAYASIDPARPEVSAKGRVVVITGGGGSIGTSTAIAFAKAGAEGIAVIGRRVGPLNECKRIVEHQYPAAKIQVVPGDVSDIDSIRDALENVANHFGKIDVLVANAGYLSKFEIITDAEPQEWWKGFETNIKGAFNTVRALMLFAASEVVLVDVSTCVVHMPAMHSASGYVSSKLASTKIFETAAKENEGLSVIHIHPGIIESELHKKSGITDPIDDPGLPGCFIVWAVSPEAEFLRGKYLWVNWDVDELKSRHAELSRPNQLTITMNGWPFAFPDRKDMFES